MIKFITDVQGDEPDILTPVQFETLVITDLQKKELFTVPAPQDGWTDSELWTVSHHYLNETVNGADAYLGDEWVGSTEV